MVVLYPFVSCVDLYIWGSFMMDKVFACWPRTFMDKMLARMSQRLVEEHMGFFFSWVMSGLHIVGYLRMEMCYQLRKRGWIMLDPKFKTYQFPGQTWKHVRLARLGTADDHKAFLDIDAKHVSLLWVCSYGCCRCLVTLGSLGVGFSCCCSCFICRFFLMWLVFSWSGSLPLLSKLPSKRAIFPGGRPWHGRARWGRDCFFLVFLLGISRARDQ